MNTNPARLCVTGLLLAAAFAGQPALADPPRHMDRPHDRHWRGDIHRFHEHDFNRWRGGRWHHGVHGGHMGWWWVVGRSWYLYSAPVHPYPDPFRPPVVYVEQPQAPVSAPAPTPAPPQNWYYCRNPAGYYPYVAQCRGQWEQVPATPPR